MLRYTVSVPKPHTGHLQVELRVDSPADPLDLVMPVWTPGSYVVQDYAGRVHGAAATDSGGRPLELARPAKHTWRVRTGGAKAIVFRYVVYAFESDVHKSYVDGERLTINGAGVFVYVDGRKTEPVELTLKFPKAWKTLATGLEPVPGAERTFVAADYDELIDCPVMAGNFTVKTFPVRDVPHHAVFVGPGNYDADQVAAETAKTVEEAIKVFDDVPYRHYTFFLEMSPESGGGLEHRNSTHMIFPRFKWRPRKDYVAAMGLVSHEFFHTWNVKRLRPAGLGPFDYCREVHTPLLWFAEGFTSYYDNLLLRRAGVITAREYLDELAREFRTLDLTPGRNLQSLEESSFETWIKFYRRTPDSPNTTISYYNKGAVFGWALDMEIRSGTKGKRSLDEVMRLLYRRFHKKRDVGITTEDIEAAVEEVAGRSLRPLFDEVVRGRGEVRYAGFLDHCGLEIADQADDENGGEARPYLGLRTRTEGGQLLVNQVLSDTPAQAAGLAARDEILAFNGYRINGDGLERRLAEAAVGRKATLLIARGGLVREIEVAPAARPAIEFAIQPAEGADARRKKLCKEWLGEDWAKIDKPRRGVDWRPREKIL